MLVRASPPRLLAHPLPAEASAMVKCISEIVAAMIQKVKKGQKVNLDNLKVRCPFPSFPSMDRWKFQLIRLIHPLDNPFGRSSAA